MFFVDRQDAGRQLAHRLDHLRGTRVVVAGIPRGGMVVAAEVARALRAPLAVCLVRKLRVPFRPELAMGVIGEGGVRIRIDAVVRAQRVSADGFAAAERREQITLDRMAACYRGAERSADLQGRTVVVVDDGMATGITAQAACRIVRMRGAARVVLALPVAPRGRTSQLHAVADELICLHSPCEFTAVADSYMRFPAVADGEVIEILEHAAKRTRTPSRESNAEPPTAWPRHSDRLHVPRHPVGSVVMLCPAGRGPDDPRVGYLLTRLHHVGLATLLVDCVAAPHSPGSGRRNALDIPRLGRRLLDATAQLREHSRLARLPTGYLVTGTGAAAAIWAAAEPGDPPAAIVAHGGRPDLAGSRALSALSVPTLLLVGAHDTAVLDLNERARTHMRCENRLLVVPAAGHVFDQPRALALAADLTCAWLGTHYNRSARLQHAGSHR